MNVLAILPPVFVVTLVVLIVMCFLRAMLCPKFADRILAAHFAMMLAALVMAVLAFRSERGGVLALTGCVCAAASYLFTLISTNSESVSKSDNKSDNEGNENNAGDAQRGGDKS